MIEVTNNATTHGGKFHADDVFSSALLKIINPQMKISRTLHLSDDFDGLVFDIGNGAFDHHQTGSEIRENGVPYAAFGLLWRELGVSLVGEEEAIRFDEKFIQPLDQDDNTGCGHPLARVISQWNPNWDATESVDACFEQAVAVAQSILEKEFDSILSAQRAVVLVEQALAEAKDNIVVLPRFAPWKMVLIPSDAAFVVYPSMREGYCAQVIPADFGDNTSKCDFPEQWAGKPAEELKKITGVETLSFCHNGRFLIATSTLEDCIKACKIAQSYKD